jgi:hypothetical protein
MIKLHKKNTYNIKELLQRVIEGSVDWGFEAKALGESIYTQAETYEELQRNIIPQSMKDKYRFS